jgi:hypothetical protein
MGRKDDKIRWRCGNNVVCTRYAGPTGNTNRLTGRSGSGSPRLSVSPHLPSHHNQCKPFPLPNLSSLYAHLHQPAPLPPQSTHRLQLTTHSPNRFLSQAPTSRDPFLARPSRLCPQTKSKARSMDKGLSTVELAAVGIQYSLSPRHPR